MTNTVDYFYAQLQNEINKVCVQDTLLITGDWKAKVGKDWAYAIQKFERGEGDQRREILQNSCLTLL